MRSEHNIKRDFVSINHITTFFLHDLNWILEEMFLDLGYRSYFDFGFLENFSLALFEERQVKSDSFFFFSFSLKSEHFLVFKEVFGDTDQFITENHLLADSDCEKGSLYSDWLRFQEDR